MRWFLAAVCATAARARDILWGTATAAYQVEGYRTADGRQPSIWDHFDTDHARSHIKWRKPDGQLNVYDGQNPAWADFDYVRYPDSA
jgi:beta-glucosidase/6-phospho-beta-glucosidase/beta-galactosidase